MKTLLAALIALPLATAGFAGPQAEPDAKAQAAEAAKARAKEKKAKAKEAKLKNKKEVKK